MTRHLKICQNHSQFVRSLEDNSKQCTKCHRVFKNQTGVYIHLTAKHFPQFRGDDKFDKNCEICHESYHSRTKHRELCGKYFHRVELANGKWRCKEKNFSRGRCRKLSSTQLGIYFHVQRAHDHPDTNEKCQRCDYTTNSKHNLAIHMCRNHRNFSRDSRDSRDSGYFNGSYASDPETLIVERPQNFPELEVFNDENPVDEDLPLPDSSMSQDEDSDIEFLEEVKQEPESPKAEQNIPESSMDEQKKSQFGLECQSDQKRGKGKEEEEDTKGFVGAVLKLYYCTFCETPFSSEFFAVDHLKKYHKIPKDFMRCLNIKNL